MRNKLVKIVIYYTPSLAEISVYNGCCHCGHHCCCNGKHWCLFRSGSGYFLGVVTEGVDTFEADAADVELSVTVEEVTFILSAEVTGKVDKYEEFSRSRSMLCSGSTIPIATGAV